MNVYKIYYAVDEGEIETAYITERTEAAARKVFKRASEGREITDVELYETDAQATKEQERETLEKIKAMVAELGPHSYLATAFDGAFEDAEQNIEYDAAFSMKARAESATAQLEEMASDCNIAKSEAARLREQLAAAREEIATLERRQLPSWLRDAARRLIADEATAAQAEMEQTADTMARLADTPEDIAFQSAVKSYRGAKELRGVCEQIVAGLDVLAEE